jgi:hypothetical protein
MYSAMSIANAMRVRRAAMKAKSDENRTSVICDERDNRRAIRVAPVANGCTARPRVESDPIVTLFEADMSSVE